MANHSAQLAQELIDCGIVHLAPTIWYVLHTSETYACKSKSPRSVTGILPPLIVELLQLRSVQPVTTSRQFDVCMMLLKQLSDTYWHASFYHQMFSQAAYPPNEKQTSVSNPVGGQRLVSLPRTNGSGQSRPRSVEPRFGPQLDSENGNCTFFDSFVTPDMERSQAQFSQAEAEMPSSESFKDTFRIEDWLNDFGYFYNDFPSA